MRLVREFIRVDFSAELARTTVQFEFRNEGPNQTVVMGFPEEVMYGRGTFRRFRQRNGWETLAGETHSMGRDQ